MRYKLIITPGLPLEQAQKKHEQAVNNFLQRIEGTEACELNTFKKDDFLCTGIFYIPPFIEIY